MRIGNPAMRRTLQRAEHGELSSLTEPATYGGVIGKCAYYLVLTLLTASLSVVLLRFVINTENVNLLVALTVASIVCAVILFVLSFVVAIAPQTVKAVGSVFSLLQGFMLGLIVALVDMFLPGVALAAVLGTVIVFILMVVLNRALGVRIRNGFFRVFVIAFLSLLAIEAVVSLLAFVFMTESAIRTYFWIQLAVTTVSVFYAATMLLWDVQAACDIVEMRADKSHEWIVAFSLITSLVYLYIELLEVIIRLAIIFSRNKK